MYDAHLFRPFTISDGVKYFFEITTIQGIGHVFSSKSTFFGKCFWLVSFSFLLGCGIVWTDQMYNNWQNNPVLTTIKATSAPIRKVKFPSVTFCSPGNMEVVSNASLFQMFYDFLRTEYGIKVNLSPMLVAETINLAVSIISNKYLLSVMWAGLSIFFSFHLIF